MDRVELSQTQIKNLAIPLVDKVQEFYKDPKNEQRFEEWYKATYGKPAPKGVIK